MYNRSSTTALIYSCRCCPLCDWQAFRVTLLFHWLHSTSLGKYGITRKNSSVDSRINSCLLVLCFSHTDGGTSTLASGWTEQNSKGEPKTDKKKKKKSPTSCVPGTFVFLFFFAYYLTNLWGTLTLGHLKRCYGLSRDRFGSVSSVGYGFSLKINKRGAYLLLKGSYCFSFVSSSSQLCRFKQFWPCSWSPSLS